MEKLLKKIKGGSNVSTIILFAIAIVFAIIGLSSMVPKDLKTEDVKAFDKSTYSEDFSSIEAYYLLGPVASDDYGQVNCYIAIGEQEFYVVMTGRNNNTGIPIITEETTEEEIEQLQLVKAIGKPVRIDSDLSQILIDTYNELQEEVVLNSFNYNLVYGNYYLDTDVTNDAGGALAVFIGFSIVFFIIGFILIITNLKKYKKIKKKLEELSDAGLLDTYDADIEAFGIENFDKQFKVLLTDNYIYDLYDDVTIIPVRDIINAYSCCIINNHISNFDYIALETKDDEVYYIALKSQDSKVKKFDKLLADIKEKIG